MNYAHLDNDLGHYFRSLPKSTQEDILQSGVVFRTKDDMHRCVSGLRGDLFLG